jgi:hypothetical protein
MQFAKDSFYMALRTRLAALNPQRVVTVGGVTRPAILVAENEVTTLTQPLSDAFYLHWGASQVVKNWIEAPAPLISIECSIRYRSTGSADVGGQDRGRTLGEMDEELRQICSPAATPTCDYTQTPPVNLETMVLWDTPKLGAVKETATDVSRDATVTVYFFSNLSAEPSVSTTLTRKARVYFAPVNRTTGTPASFDAAKNGRFPPDDPPAPWIDGGWIENLKRTSGTKIDAVRCGGRGVATAQFRSNIDAHVEFDFLQWGKLQMALSAGSQHLNLIEEPAQSGAAVPGAAGNAIPLQSGSTASQLAVGASAAEQFSPGDQVAVDVDYTGSQGFVGTGVSGAYVLTAGAIQDPDYVRQVTFNVGRVASLADGTLTLHTNLIGGAPSANAKVQKVVGFEDREGGSYFQEWSALIVISDDAGSRLIFYYPRLQPCMPAQEFAMPVEAPLEAIGLHASFIALPVTDAIDGESVLCYRSYLPVPKPATS